MEKCKFCQAELPEGETLCPACGKDNGAKAPENTPVMEDLPETTPVMEDIPMTLPLPKEALAAVEEAVAAATEASGEAVPAEEAPAEEETPAEEEAPAEAEAPAEEETPAEAASEETEDAQASPEIQPGVQATPGKIALAVGVIVVLLAVLVALILAGMKPGDVAAETPVETAAPVETVPATVPADGEPGTIFEKGTYSVTDEEALAVGDLVVATVGEKELTNSELQVYYWMELQSFLQNYGSYAAYFGLDYTRPLDTQLSMEGGGMTWQQYFLQVALSNWQQIQSMKQEAEAAGLTLTEEDQKYLDGIPADLEQTAASNGMSLEDLMRTSLGPASGVEEFIKFQTDYRHGSMFYEAQIETFVPTEEDLDAHYAAYQDQYAESGLVKDAELVAVRHILVTPESTAGDGTYSEADWEACKTAAQELLDTWKAGDMTEDSFAALATEKTTDPGSKETGGLYGEVYTGQMVQPFNDWCFDESRKTGDTDLVQTDYGYHVMYFVKAYEGTHPLWKQTMEEDWYNEKVSVMFEDLMAKYPLNADYSKIALAYVPVA